METAAIILAAAILLGGKFEMPAFLQKKPQTEQLQKAQQDLEAARAAQAAAEAALAAARAAEQARGEAQLDYAQQFAVGTSEALARVPAEHRSPEVTLAAEFSSRTVAGLEAYRGKLSPQLAAEMRAMIDQALSAVAAERDAYRAALAARDAELRTVTTERIHLAQQVAALDADLKVKAAEVAHKETVVQAKTAEVVDYANKHAAERARSGSLEAYVSRGVRLVVILALGYFLVAFGLPGLIKHLDAGPLKTFLRNLSGYASSPLLFHDAKKKLSSK